MAANVPMVNTKPDPNVLTYNAPAVAEYYAALNYLTPCEQLLFDAYVKPGMAILDLGVGGGRTTPYLSSLASRYVGVDYANEMIAACRRKFPRLEFDTGNAADLSFLTSAGFDAVVMAFNGMDYVIPDEARFRALREIGRVLKPEGILIFSSHNPRSIWVRPSWNPQRVRALAQTIAGSRPVFYQPVLRLLAGMRVGLALLQSVSKSINRSIHKLPTRTFWRGRGFLMDSAHGGLMTYFGTPKNIVQDLQPIGFQSMRVLGDDYPRVSRLYTTDWYYYVFSKAEGMGER